MDGKGFRFAQPTVVIVLFVCCIGAATGTAHGQDATDTPPPPTASSDDPSVSPDEPSDRMSRIEDHLRQLEEYNQQLQRRYDDLWRKYDNVLQQSNDPVFGARQGNADGKGVPGAVNLRPASLMRQNQEQTGEGGAGEPSAGRRRTGEPEANEDEEDEPTASSSSPSARARQSRGHVRSQTGLSGAGQRVGDEWSGVMDDYVENRGPYSPDMRPLRVPGDVSFREGLEIRTKDDFFTLEFHNLTQLDLRIFDRTGDALHDNFVIPRQRWYFQGQVSPYAYYYTAINRGYGSLDILDSWVDFNFAPKYKAQLQFRVGRMKTPYTYEYIKISESDLIAPERSLFVGNFAGNRQLGVMAHGRVFEQVVEYYVGVFNGPRRSFEDDNNSKDVYTFLNFTPFIHSGIDWLDHLNLGGSVNGGTERNPTQPAQLSTANDQSTSASIINVSPTFLTFNSNAFENGMRMQWSGDLAYYYKSFTMLTGYQGGFQNYSLAGAPVQEIKAFNNGTAAFVGVGSSRRTRVPLEGWSIAATYFLTGEQITRRVYLTEPVRPFGFYNGRLNPGAIELYSRFANLQVGDQIFTGGFANPALWANRANAIDTGVNWYLNHYVRFYFDWQHAMFNNPVLLGTNKFTKHEDLFWFRTQVFF